MRVTRHRECRLERGEKGGGERVGGEGERGGMEGEGREREREDTNNEIKKRFSSCNAHLELFSGSL